MMDPQQAEAIRALFAEHSVTGEDIRVLVPQNDDEAVFVISTTAAAGMQERELTMALSALLRRKVWVVTDGPQWRGRTERLG